MRGTIDEKTHDNSVVAISMPVDLGMNFVLILSNECDKCTDDEIFL